MIEETISQDFKLKNIDETRHSSTWRNKLEWIDE